MNKEKLNELRALQDKLWNDKNEYVLIFYNTINDFICLYEDFFEYKSDNDFDDVEHFMTKLDGFIEVVYNLYHFFKTKNDVDVNNVLMLMIELYRDVVHAYRDFRHDYFCRRLG